MKTANANAYRATTIKELFDYFSAKGEDCGMIASNSFNMPIVIEGEEGFAEIVVKVTKDKDSDDGYLKREQWNDKCREKAEKAKHAAEVKAKKIAADEKRRKEKKKEE